MITQTSHDGMSIIEWDCDTTGLESMDLDGVTYYRLSDYFIPEQMSAYLTADGSTVGYDKLISSDIEGVPAFLVTDSSYSAFVVMGFSADVTADGVSYAEGLWVAPGDATSFVIVYTKGLSVVKSSGDGFALFDGHKIPVLPEWNREVYSHYYIFATYVNYEGGGYVYNLVATDTPLYNCDDSDLITIVGVQNRCKFTFASTAAISELWGYPLAQWPDTPEIDTVGSDDFSDVYWSLSECIYASHDIYGSTMDDVIAVPNETVALAASEEPIYLDGMTVIEWNGDKTDLTTAGSFTLISELTPDTGKSVAFATFNSDGTKYIAGEDTDGAALDSDNGYYYWSSGSMLFRYYPAATDFAPAAGIYFNTPSGDTAFRSWLFAFYEGEAIIYETEYAVTSAGLIATADAIRAKTGDTAKITWNKDTGFAGAVGAIPVAADEKANSLCIVGIVPKKEYPTVGIAQHEASIVGNVPQGSYPDTAITQYAQPMVGEFEVTT